MIRPIKIKLNAAHPELPLVEATTFVGSPSTVFVCDVPKAVGSWRISTVKVVAHYPDDSATTVECVKGADGVYVATIPATATSGRVANGLQIIADGIDERGEAVTGYVLGMADFAVFTRDMTIESGGTVWYMHYFDAVPQTAKKGDVAPDGSGGLQFYNGTAWQPFAVVPPIQYPVTNVTVNGTSVMDGTVAKINLGTAAAKDVPASGNASASQVVMGNDTRLANARTPTAHASTHATNGSDPIIPANIGALGNSGDQNLDGSLSFWSGNLIFYFEDAVLTPVIYLWSGLVRIEFPAQSGTLARLEDIPSVSGLAPLASPAFTGTPTAPTPTSGDDSTKIATTAFVQGAVGAIKTFQHDAGGYYIEVEAS